MLIYMVGCARCHEDGHGALEFEELVHPVVHDDGTVFATHWATCPTNGQPILCEVVTKEE